MAVNDPFAEDLSHPEGPSNPVSNFFARLRNSVHGDEENAAAQAAAGGDASSANNVNHSRTNSQHSDRSLQQQQHPRTISFDIEDHMEGSVHLGTDICSSCGYPRMSTVFCSVSQLHHGTDLPMETPSKKRKSQSIFARLRDSMAGLTPGNADPPLEDTQPSSPAMAEGASPLPMDGFNGSSGDAGDSTTSSANGAADSVQGFSLSGIFSKTKEEKQLVDLMHQEEKERLAIKQNAKLCAHEIERQLTCIHKDIREILKEHERQRNLTAYEFKVQFDEIYLERKKELHDFKDQFELELKLLCKKEKERRKHGTGAGGGSDLLSPRKIEGDPSPSLAPAPEQ